MKQSLILILGMMMAACAKTGAPAPPSASSPRFLALGDSYTIGQSIDPADRWPVQLARALTKAGTPVGDPTIIAQTGWTTADLLGAIDQAKPQGPYDLVALLIGVNNQFQGRSQDEYRTQFKELLDRAITLAGNRPTHVIVLSIPDWGVTPFAANMGANAATVATAIDQFNAINKSESAAAGVAYVDITPISRAHLHADDGLHPSAQMYALWVQATLPAVQRSLAAPDHKLN